MDFTQQFKNWRNGMYRKTVEELQKDQREKLVIDIRSEQDYIKETYPEGAASVSVLLYRAKKR